jgi:hypothetical protein
MTIEKLPELPELDEDHDPTLPDDVPDGDAGYYEPEKEAPDGDEGEG